jgi:F-type H+-transporting ATPase subunit b
MQDLADTEVEQKAIQVFLDRIKNLESQTRSEVVDALRGSDSRLVVRTGFDVPSELREDIVGTLRDELDAELEPDFETNPDIGFGIELKTPGRKVSWHASEYLESLEEQTMKALDRYTEDSAEADAEEHESDNPK